MCSLLTVGRGEIGRQALRPADLGLVVARQLVTDLPLQTLSPNAQLRPPRWGFAYATLPAVCSGLVAHESHEVAERDVDVEDVQAE